MAELVLPKNTIQAASPVLPATPVSTAAANAGNKTDGAARSGDKTTADNERNDFAKALDRQMETRDAASEPAATGAKAAPAADSGDAAKPAEPNTTAVAPDIASLLQGLMLPPAQHPVSPAAGNAAGNAEEAGTATGGLAADLRLALGGPGAGTDAAAGVKAQGEERGAADLRSTAKNAGDFAAELAAAADPAAAKGSATALLQPDAGMLPNAGGDTQQGSNIAALQGQAWAHTRAVQDTNSASERAVVQTPVGTPGWAADLGNHVSMLIGKESSSAELILTPPHLGRVEVQLTVDGNQTSAQFVAATPAARDALEQALPKLREFLADAGINLSQASVGSESSRNGSSEHGAAGGRRGAGSADVTNITAAPAWVRRSDGMVDTFA